MTQRIPGLLYLLVIITGAFSIGYVPGQLFTSSDPAAIVAAVRDALPLLRAGIAAGIICYVAFLVLPLSLYRPLAPWGPRAAALMVAFATISVPISLAALGQRYEILALVEGGGTLSGWSAAQIEAAVALADARYDLALSMAMVFWGLWLLPLGYLILKSAALPRVLGVLLLLGGTGYVVSVLGSILSPEFASSKWSSWIIMPATLGELGTCLALLVKPPTERNATPA
jgi:hypothetical protein